MMERARYQPAVLPAGESTIKEPEFQAVSGHGRSLDVVSPKGQGHSVLFRMEAEWTKNQG